MKKLLISIVIALFLPTLASAAPITALWNATSTNIGYIAPTAISGNIPFIQVPYIVGTTTATSTFAGGINITSGCFSKNGTCLTSGGSTSPAGSNGQLQFNSSGTFGGASNTFYKNSNGYLGIGTTNPGAPIHLNIGSGTFTPVTDEAMILQRNQTTSDNLALTLVSGTSGSSLIRFATNANTEPGRIIYNQIQNSMAFQSNSAEAFRISSNQNMSINSTDSDSPLHVVGKNAIVGQGLITDDGSGDITGDGSTTFVETFSIGDIITVPDTGESARITSISDDNDMTVTPATSASNNSYTYNRGFRADDSSGQPLIKTTDSATTFYSPSSHPVEIDKCGQAPTPNSDSNAAFKIEVGIGCAGNEWTNLPTAAEGPGQSWTLGVTEDGAYKSGFSYLNSDGILAMQTNIANPFSSTGLFLEPTNSFVGIETRAPITQLDVKGSGTNASPVNIRAGTNLGTVGQSVALNFSESTGVVTTGSISNIAQDAHNIKLQFSTYNDAISGTATDKMDILGNGNVGIATSTPYSKLSVGGQVVAANYVATTTATSTFVGGVQANIFNATSATASSTFANGINLQAGCFSIKGTCLSSGGATSPATPTKSVQFNNSGAFGGSSNFIWDNSNAFLGISTSTPYASLSVEGNGVLNGRLDVQNELSNPYPWGKTDFSVVPEILCGDTCTNEGVQVGINTDAPLSSTVLDIINPASLFAPNIYFDSYSGFSAQAPQANFVFRAARGPSSGFGGTAVQSGDSIGTVGVEPYATSDFTSSPTASMAFFSSQNITSSHWGTYMTFNTTPNNSTSLAERARLDQNGNFGIGTTTPYAALSIQYASTTGDVFAIATSTGNAIGGYDTDGHRFTSGYKPSISTCGTGTGTVVGDDQSGTITTATAATACTMTFAKAYRNAPVCTVTDNSLVGFADISSASTGSVTFGISSALTGGLLYYQCSYHR